MPCKLAATDQGHRKGFSLLGLWLDFFRKLDMSTNPASGNVPGHRMAAFKNRGNMQQDELRRRREDVAVEIRKAKREESLAKRRNMTVGASAADSDEEENAVPAPVLETQMQEMVAVYICFFIR